MARPRANQRLFVAAYPPPEIARSMLEALASLDLPAHRTTPPEQIHLTLQFIGDIPVRDLDHAKESVRAAARGMTAVRLHTEALIMLPERGPARLIAARTDCPATIAEIHRRLVTRFARAPRRGDGYLPHLTLARFGESTSSGSTKAFPIDVAPFEVETIQLMRSRLAPSGATHHLLEEVPLR